MSERAHMAVGQVQAFYVWVTNKQIGKINKQYIVRAGEIIHPLVYFTISSLSFFIRTDIFDVRYK